MPIEAFSNHPVANGVIWAIGNPLIRPSLALAEYEISWIRRICHDLSRLLEICSRAEAFGADEAPEWMQSGLCRIGHAYASP